MIALYPLPSAIILNKLTSSLPFTCRFFSKPLSYVNRFSTTSFSTLPQQHLSYGPSLYKGHKIARQNSDKLDEENFTRIFDITALRVPSEHCFSLESKLRGHLLNWPRIRNIARVPGDDIEDELKEFIGNDNNNANDKTLKVLERRIYGKGEGDGEKMCEVLYRDKLARTFNSTGYVKFENLAKISRPKKKKKWKREGNGRERRGNGRSDMSIVEVGEEEGNGDDEDFNGLLGGEFRRRKWSGSTRLLLLDERYANEGIEEMPEAIKVSVLF